MFAYIQKFRELGLLFFIIAISIAVQFRNPSFLTSDNINNLLINNAILSIMAIGMMLVIITRGIDLSVASTMGLSGMTVSLLVADTAISPISAIVVGISLGIICGAIIGFLISKLDVLPIIATLAAMFIIRGLAHLISSGRWVVAHQMSDGFLNIGRGTIFGLNYLIAISFAVFIIFYYFLNHTTTGRQIYAVGSNPISAKISGINNSKIIFLVYTIMGGLSGLAGVLWVSRFASAQSGIATGYELNVIAAVILGGVSITGGSGKIFGVFLGALLIGILNNALPLIGISPFWQMAIQGSIILLAVIFNIIVKRNVDKARLLERGI